MKLELTEAQLLAIINMADYMEVMLGNGGHILMETAKSRTIICVATSG